MTVAETVLPLNRVLCGDSLQVLKSLPSESVDMVFTSPPYFALRDYKVEGQIGREDSLPDYLKNLWAIFDECRRVLKPSGSVWVNLGDTFAGSGGAGGDYVDGGLKEGQPPYRQKRQTGIRRKSLMKIPERFSTGMVDRGWIERDKVIWLKPNGMIESSKDRIKLDYENLYCYVKEEKYWFNYLEAKKPLKSATVKRNAYPVAGIVSLDIGANSRYSNKKKKFAPPIGDRKSVV